MHGYDAKYLTCGQAACRCGDIVFSKVIIFPLRGFVDSLID